MSTAPARKRHVDLAADGVEVSVSTVGAEVGSIRGTDGQEYLWPAGPQWPRHAPVLFPHICSQPGDRIIVDGVGYPASHHGFARDRLFEIVSRSSAHVTMRLTADEWTLQRYPYQFSLEVTYRIDDASLDVLFEVCNHGTDVMPFALGWHPAFNWPLDSDRGRHSIEFDAAEPGRIRRIVDGFLGPQRFGTAAPEARLVLDDSLFDAGALIIDSLGSSSLRYESPSGRGVRMSWTGFDSLALWSPADADLLCIEPWLGLAATAETMEWADRPELTHLEPGGAVRCSVTVTPTPSTAGDRVSHAVSAALAQHMHDPAR